MASRKRRREEAFPEEDEIPQRDATEEDSVLDEKERTEKEQEVWDAIREAHYEAIEQLPLTLHRQLSLMRQLDEQTIACTARLLPALGQYIKMRQSLSNWSLETHSQSTTTAMLGDTDGHTAMGSNGRVKDLPEIDLVAPLRRLRNSEGQPSPRPSTPLPMPLERQNSPQTTRELLSHLAWMSEELIRASQEKVNLAQANHDSVERHIQLLDQAIKEQETSLSQDPSRHNNGISIHLPEIVVPQWNRNARTTQSSSEEELAAAAEVLPSAREGTKASQSGSGKKGKESTSTQKVPKGEPGKDPASLTITLPATQPNEELYCYCDRISFGEMIACDNDSCEKEWFHLGCVGLTEPPEGEWFCEDCRVDEA